MKRLAIAAIVAAIPAGLLAAQTAQPASPKQSDPPAAQTAAPAPPPPASKTVPASSHSTTQPFGVAEQTAMVKTYCAGCHNDRMKAGQLSLAVVRRRRSGDAYRDDGEDDPQAARRHDAAAGREAARARADSGAGDRARDPSRSRGVAQSQPRLASVPAAQPRGVRPSGEGPVRPRHRRRRIPPRRHHQRRLRQRRRRAGILGDAARRLPPRGRQGDGACDRGSRGRGVGDQLPRAEDRVAAVARGRRAVWHSRRSVAPAHVPRRRRVRVQGRAALERLRRAVRRSERW